MFIGEDHGKKEAEKQAEAPERRALYDDCVYSGSPIVVTTGTTRLRFNLMLGARRDEVAGIARAFSRAALDALITQIERRQTGQARS